MASARIVSVLEQAIKGNDISYIKNYIRHRCQHGCIDNTELSEGLYQAAKVGNYDIAQLLITLIPDIDVNFTCPGGNSILVMAIKNDNLDIVRLLIESGACVNKNNTIRTTMPLHTAAESGNVDTLKYLLEVGANIDEVDGTGKTSLLCAIKNKRVENVSVLVNRGASICDAGQSGIPPLRAAVLSECVEVVNILLDAGADPNYRPSDWSCPLLHTVLSLQSTRCSKKILEAMLHAGATLDTKDTYGYTAIQECILVCRNDKFSFENLKLLTQSGAGLHSVERNRSIKNYDDESSLYLLLCHRQYKALKYLILSGWNLRSEPYMRAILSSLRNPDPELYSYVLYRLHNPCSLLELSRKSIRTHLLHCTSGRSIMLRSRRLPLPRQLLDFVCLMNFT